MTSHGGGGVVLVQLVDTVSGKSKELFSSLTKKKSKKRVQESKKNSNAAPVKVVPQIARLAWSLDSRILLTALDSGEIVVWDAASHTFGGGKKKNRHAPAAAASAASRKGSRSVSISRNISRAGSRNNSVAASGGGLPGGAAGRTGAGVGGGSSAPGSPKPAAVVRDDVLARARRAPWSGEEQYIGSIVDCLATSQAERDIQDMVFSPDGQTLLVVSRGRVPKLWDFGAALAAFVGTWRSCGCGVVSTCL